VSKLFALVLYIREAGYCPSGASLRFDLKYEMRLKVTDRDKQTSLLAVALITANKIFIKRASLIKENSILENLLAAMA
jgi:hypothetical protein